MILKGTFVVVIIILPVFFFIIIGIETGRDLPHAMVDVHYVWNGVMREISNGYVGEGLGCKT